MVEEVVEGGDDEEDGGVGDAAAEVSARVEVTVLTVPSETKVLVMVTVDVDVVVVVGSPPYCCAIAGAVLANRMAPMKARMIDMQRGMTTETYVAVV